ncbi:MAG: beta-1,6-N-acetylglucosaminyltransferase [Maledivibacter sp.]|jgi:hypothetical protein|nr:beta-1,6-N-acetylglucosaminyltransferase [Maledivibacter sp.]
MQLSLDSKVKKHNKKANKKKVNNRKVNKIKDNNRLKVAFLILAHKNPSQIVTFINALDCENTTFFIHINKESHIIDHSLLQNINKKDNVFFIEKRQKVTKGGYSMVAATLLLLKECLKKDKYDYISLHSGQDLPIKNKYEILDFLKKNRGKEFLRFTKVPRKGWGIGDGLHRIEYYWFIDEFGFDRSYKLYEKQKELNIKRKYFEDIQLYGGSLWNTITGECAQFIIDYVSKNKSFCDYYKYTLYPDEEIFHTIILNSHFKDRVINNNLRYIDWRSGPQKPRILTKNDYKKLIISDKLFARKFDINVDNKIIQKITNRIMGN